MAAGAGKPASITLTLNKGPFKDGLKDAEKDVKTFSQQANAALKGAFSDGIKGAGSAVSGMFSTIKNGLAMMSGIGGAMGTAELIRAATVTAGVYKGMAAGVKLGTGGAADFRDMMTQGSAAAQKWGKDVDEIGAAMKRVRDETGDLDFAKKSADVIAMASRASHESIDSLAGLSASLHKQFSITDDKLQDTLATVLSLGNKGGVGVAQLSDAIKAFGPIAKQAGIAGEQGLGKFLGLLSAGASGTAGMQRNIGGATSILASLASPTSPERAQMLMKAGITGFGSGLYGDLDPWSKSMQKKDPFEALKMMVAQMGGKAQRIDLTFSGDQAAFLKDIGKVYESTYASTKGGESKKREAALAALDEAINKAAQGAVDGADLQKMATDEMKDGPAKMEAAIERMRAAFMRPEIADAISKLADALPKLAEVVSKVVGFALEHPYQAGAIAVGGVAAKGFAGAATDSLFNAGGKVLSGYIEGALGIGGKAAGSAAAAAIGESGTAVGAAAGRGILASAGPWAIAAASAMAVYQAYTTYKHLDEKSKGHGMEYWALNAKHNIMDTLGLESDTEKETYWKKRKALTGEETPYDAIWARDEALARRDSEGKGHAADEALAGMSFSAEDMGAGGSSTEGPAPFRFDLANAPRAAQAPQQSAQDMALLREMLGKTLPVKIENVEALRAAIGASPGNPRPGYVPRE